MYQNRGFNSNNNNFPSNGGFQGNFNSSRNNNNNMPIPRSLGGSNNIPNNNWARPERINSVGTVTEMAGQSGIINDEVFFDLNACIGPWPKLCDQVAFEAISTPFARFKWTASKVQVMSSMQVNWNQDGPRNNQWGGLLQSGNSSSNAPLLSTLNSLSNLNSLRSLNNLSALRTLNDIANGGHSRYRSGDDFPSSSRRGGDRDIRDRRDDMPPRRRRDNSRDRPLRRRGDLDRDIDRPLRRRGDGAIERPIRRRGTRGGQRRREPRRDGGLRNANGEANARVTKRPIRRGRRGGRGGRVGPAKKKSENAAAKAPAETENKASNQNGKKAGGATADKKDNNSPRLVGATLKLFNELRKKGVSKAEADKIIKARNRRRVAMTAAKRGAPRAKRFSGGQIRAIAKLVSEGVSVRKARIIALKRLNRSKMTNAI